MAVNEHRQHPNYYFMQAEWLDSMAEVQRKSLTPLRQREDIVGVPTEKGSFGENSGQSVHAVKRLPRVLSEWTFFDEIPPNPPFTKGGLGLAFPLPLPKGVEGIFLARLLITSLFVGSVKCHFLG
jgi:hypothetical protein